MFRRYIGIDYTGGAKPTHRKKELAVCSITGDGCAVFPVQELRNGSRSWSRRDLADWLVVQLWRYKVPTLVGIDHAFSFPREYFRKYGLLKARNDETSGARWSRFLADFQEKWPTREQAVEPLKRCNKCRNAKDNCKIVNERLNDHRWGERHWMRLADLRASGAKSVFDFHPVPRQAQVAKSTHAGLPWLLDIRERLVEKNMEVHFWPFDGWAIPDGHSAIVEVYPALWNQRFPDYPAGNNEAKNKKHHRRDAYSVARWMWEQDQHGLLGQYFNFGMPDEDKCQAQAEGWILGLLW